MLTLAFVEPKSKDNCMADQAETRGEAPTLGLALNYVAEGIGLWRGWIVRSTEPNDTRYCFDDAGEEITDVPYGYVAREITADMARMLLNSSSDEEMARVGVEDPPLPED